MHLVKLPYVCNEIEPGWTLMKDDVPLGREYLIDLDLVLPMTITCRETGRQMQNVRCFWVVWPEPAGWMPDIVFGL